jgi:hypothetical protein
MSTSIRYGDYLRGIGAGRREVSLNALLPSIPRGDTGAPVPMPPQKLPLHPDEVVARLRPYVAIRFKEQFKAVVPLAMYLALLQIVILRQIVADSWLITADSLR